MRSRPGDLANSRARRRIIARETGQPLEKVSADMERDFWMNAEEAIEYGIVSRIIEDRRDLQ